MSLFVPPFMPLSPHCAVAFYHIRRVFEALKLNLERFPADVDDKQKAAHMQMHSFPLCEVPLTPQGRPPPEEQSLISRV